VQAYSLSNTAAIPHPAFPLPDLAEGPGLAHDAGNLLGALALYSDLLRAPGVLRPEHQHYASELRMLSERSSVLIRRLLSSPSSSAAATWVDGGSAGLKALAPVLERLAAPDATVTLRLAHDLPLLPFPAESLERIVVNLVRNAAEALRRQRNPNGRVKVALTSDGTHLRLTVADNGPGLDPVVAARFLSPDLRDRIPPHGRGLGHRIVYDLVTATGGTLDVRVRPRHGSVFTVTWNCPATTRQMSPSAGQVEQGTVCA
jgi:signal transduction histidine kinase